MIMKERFKDNEVYGPYILPEVKVTPSKQDKSNLVARRVNQGINEIGYNYISPIISELVPGSAAMDWLISKGVKKVADKISPEIINMLLTGDKYTTPGAKFGYYGNPIERVYGTMARKLNLPDKPRKPELLRKLEDPIKSYGNTVEITARDNNPSLFTNFTTDRPVVTHSKSGWDHTDLYIFDPNVTKNIKPSSIEPSDTFYVGHTITSTPKQTTLVSGNIKNLKDAQKKGINILSSPQARNLWQQITNQYQTALNNYNPLDRLQKVPTIRNSVDDNLKLEYSKELQRLQSKRGTPTFKDYLKWQKETGLKAGVRPIKYKQRFIDNPPIEGAFNPMEFLEGVNTSTDMGKKLYYPNGQPVTTIEQFEKELDLINRQPYNKVFYDPASKVEFNYYNKNKLERR